MFNINMPLTPHPRMRDKDDLRKIKAEMPDDVTQREFWEFVIMAGTRLFGTKEPEAISGQYVASWNPIESFNVSFRSPGSS